MALVFAIVVVALVLFATEPVPVDVTAIGVAVALMVLEPWTRVDPAAGLSGFSSTATITVLAMFVLSAGVQATGVVQLLGEYVARYTRDSETRQLAATAGIVAPISGFINNTAAVAILLPMVTDLANDAGTSPSKLLIPLSYASMFGGTLTVIGTSTNILASALAADLTGSGFSMFEFTQLGVVVTVVGTVYLVFVSPRLIPERIPPTEDLTEEFRMADYLTEVVVREDSPLVGRTVREALAETEFDADVLQIVRGDEVFLEPLARKTIRAGDIFLVRTDRDTLVQLADLDGLELAPDATVTEDELDVADEGQNLVEIVVPTGSSLVGETLASGGFRDRYDATVLAFRRGSELVRQRMDRIPLRVGDTLLVQATVDSVERLDANPDFIVTGEVEHQYRDASIPVAVGIVVAVVGLAALDVLPIVVSALAGSVAMVVAGVIRPGELYDAVQWDVIFLLAGVIPLGLALQRTGGAEFLAELVLLASGVLPAVAVLGLFYLLTVALTNVISNNAAVVLMIPVAYEAALELGAEPFSYLLAVTFAASTAFMTPIGYQTNLFVYGPGGYTFGDYFRVGTPLQLVFAVVTTVGIWAFWGV